MTKAELIRKVAKNVGVPDTDAKIFFELLLKRISAVVEIGQSIFVKDFGYFHLIKGSFKKPVFSFNDNEVSEEDVELVLFSEEKNLRKSDAKGLVFNIPFLDEDDYHPIDSIFSLSIGKPLIPLRGVPSDNIYVPTSGYEYRRLIESKVEKIISESAIEESVENFPTLVIDARSYNSNQVQLQWDDISKIDSAVHPQNEDEIKSDEKAELSQYERQAKELKNIAWDFGEDLSQQIEAESILDITDERINMNASPKTESNTKENNVKIENQPEHSKSVEENFKPEKEPVNEQKLVADIKQDHSSEKLNELLESEIESTENFEEEILKQHIDEKYRESFFETEDQFKDELSQDIIVEDTVEEVEKMVNKNMPTETELSDEEFWKSTSKYFEPYKPGAEKIPAENILQVNQINNIPEKIDPVNLDKKMDDDIRDVIKSEIVLDEHSALEENIAEIKNEIQENIMNENNDDEKSELENSAEQKAEYFEPVRTKRLIPFIVFPIIVICLSIALYWYLEFYKKNEVAPKPVQIVLNSNNAKIVQRNFDIPVTYPYLPRVNQTTISETVTPKIEEQNLISEKNTIIKTDPVKTEEKKIENELPKQKVTETSKPSEHLVPTGKPLNVGNNIYKYANYFVVQVAAFRSSSISENEAGKYRNKGYNAFVEAAEIPERGIWYRVRVGNFSSKEEAQRFLEKNIR